MMGVTACLMQSTQIKFYGYEKCLQQTFNKINEFFAITDIMV